MKVIGKSDAGYLIAASEHEIANLFGFSSSYDNDYRGLVERAGHFNSSSYGPQKDLIGMEIRPSEAYNQLAWLRQRDREFDQLCKQLRSTADAIQNSQPLFDLIIADKPSGAT